MNKTLLMFCLGAMGVLPGLALAQDANPGGAGRDPEKMREMFDARFKKADANGDGKLTKAEAQAGMPRIAKNFDAIDANKDGLVTPEEIRAAMASRGATKGGAQGAQSAQ